MVGGLSLPNETSSGHYRATLLREDEAPNLPKSKDRWSKTLHFLDGQKSEKVLNFIHSESFLFFLREFDGIIEINGPARKICEVFGQFGCVFCFDAIDKHLAKYQVTPNATLAFCVNLNTTALGFVVVTCCCNRSVHPCTTETCLISLCFWWFSQWPSLLGFQVRRFKGFALSLKRSSFRDLGTWHLERTSDIHLRIMPTLTGHFDEECSFQDRK